MGEPLACLSLPISTTTLARAFKSADDLLIECVDLGPRGGQSIIVIFRHAGRCIGAGAEGQTPVGPRTEY